MVTPQPNMPDDTAAVSWISGGVASIRVYSSDGYNVTERCSDDGGNTWYTGGFAQQGSQVSATAWLDSTGSNIHVYCTEADATTEWVWGGGSGWRQGTYTPS